MSVPSTWPGVEARFAAPHAPAGGRATNVVASGVAIAAAAFLLYSNVLVAFARNGVIPTATAALVPALLLFAVLHRMIMHRQSLVVDRTLLAMLAFLAVLLTSAFGAKGYDEAAARITTYAIEGLVTYMLVRNAVQHLGDLRLAVLGVMSASTLLCVLAIVQAFTGNYEQDFVRLAQRSLEHLDGGRVTAPSIGSDMRLEDRAYGPVGDPNRFAQMLLMALPLALAVAIDGRSRGGRLVAGVTTLLILGGVFVTYSRGGFLTLVVMAVLAVSGGLVRMRGLVLAALLALAISPVVAPGYTGRMISISGVAALWGSNEVQADGATRGRTTEMLAALAAYNDHPVLGVGPGQYLPYYSQHYQALPEISVREIAEPRRAHSLYFEMAAELGTIGLVVFMAIPLLLLRDLRQLRLHLRERDPELARLAAAFSLAVLAYLGTGVFLHLAFERYYWFMIGLAAAAAAVLDRCAREADRLGDDDAWPIHAAPGWGSRPC